jgi:hypothetical protein
MAVVSIGMVAARATSLVPGSAIPLSLEAEPAVGATLIVSASVPVTGLTFGGTLVSSVYANDSSNPWGGLTFTYQLFNNGPDTVERLTLSSYTGFFTDVSYSGAAVAPLISVGTEVVPLNAVRTASGNQISFNFRDAAEQATLIPGANSPLLIIQTDSTVYQNSIAGVINSSTANTATFAPAAVPEPATATLVVLGVVACLLERRLKS